VGLDAYIPDKRFRRQDPRFEREHRQRQRRTDRLVLADFEYQEKRDEYRCPQGEVFRLDVKTAIADGGHQQPDPDEEPWRAGHQARKMNF
jgi:hypothetical protein